VAKYLDETGLAYYTEKLKGKLDAKADVAAVPVKTSQLQNDSGFITSADVPDGAAASNTVPKADGTAAVGTETTFARGDHVHPTDTTRLGTSGDGSNVTVTFNAAAERGAVESGDTLGTAMGKLAKSYSDLGALAYKDAVGKTELSSEVQASLGKADTALQSFTEQDPTVPAWAKEATKPAYTAAEVGAIPAADADTFARKSELTNVYKYKGSVATEAELPAADNVAGDVYNVEANDMNFAWNGTKWDPLGASFSIQSITNTEIDAILAS